MGSVRLESCLRIAVAIEATLVACMDAAGTMSFFLFYISRRVPAFATSETTGERSGFLCSRGSFFLRRRLPGMEAKPAIPAIRNVSFAWVIEDVLALPHHIASSWGKAQRSLSFFTITILFVGNVIRGSLPREYLGGVCGVAHRLAVAHP